MSNALTFVEDCVNNVFGEIVNELRLVTRDQNLKEIERKVPIDDLIARAKLVIAGQSGYEIAGVVVDPQDWDEDDIVDAPDTSNIDDAQIRAALLKVAALWKFVLEGDLVVFRVLKPNPPWLKKLLKKA